MGYEVKQHVKEYIFLFFDNVMCGYIKTKGFLGASALDVILKVTAGVLSIVYLSQER